MTTSQRKDRRSDPESLKIRKLLMAHLQELIRFRSLTQVEAAQWLRTTQPQISLLMHGHVDRFSVDTLINMLAYAGIRLSIEFVAQKRAGGE